MEAMSLQLRSPKTPPKHHHCQMTLELEKQPPNVPMANNVRSKCLRLIAELISSVATKAGPSERGHDER
jgi:hypothetical protein